MRCIHFAEDTAIQLQNRRMIDVSVRYPEITALRKQIKAENAILDGELVVLTGGKPDFYKLQSRFHLQNRARIDWCAERMPATFVVFDILYLNGESCLNVPLYRRKEMIEGIIEKSPRMIISRPFSVSGIGCLKRSAGVILKASSPKGVTVRIAWEAFGKLAQDQGKAFPDMSYCRFKDQRGSLRRTY